MEPVSTQVRPRSQSAQDNAKKIRAESIARRTQSELRKLDAIPDADPRELKSIEEALMSKSAKQVLKNKVKNNDEDAPVPHTSKLQRTAKHVEPEPIPQFQPPARAKSSRGSEDKDVVPVFTKNKNNFQLHALSHTPSRKSHHEPGRSQGRNGRRKRRRLYQ